MFLPDPLRSSRRVSHFSSEPKATEQSRSGVPLVKPKVLLYALHMGALLRITLLNFWSLRKWRSFSWKLPEKMGNLRGTPVKPMDFSLGPLFKSRILKFTNCAPEANTCLVLGQKLKSAGVPQLVSNGLSLAAMCPG